ncbi:MAG: GNAT family N-acetyltransferase [Anaerolineae bacterium]|nr:GNAT family N-acetyltransferase [Anaerolineae bacterium]
MNANILQNDRARLTALTPDDIPAMLPWFEDAGFMRHLDACPAKPKTASELKKWVEDMQSSNDGFILAVRPAGGEDLTGVVEIDGILWTHQVTWLAIGIAPGMQGKGYGRAAMELALKFAFDELNLHRVQLTVFAYNTRAIALYEALGFTREGIYREFLLRDGQRYDMYLYGLLRREWAMER